MTLVNNTHQISFFRVYHNQRSFLRIPRLYPINCQVIDIGGNYYHRILLDKRNLSILLRQYKESIIYIMTRYNLVESTNVANVILAYVGNQNSVNPDEIKEFQNYVDSFINNMISICSSMHYSIMKKISKYFITSDQNNNRIMFTRTLTFKQIIYKDYLKSFLITYNKLKKV